MGKLSRILMASGGLPEDTSSGVYDGTRFNGLTTDHHPSQCIFYH